jgi:hypothetical protein
MLRDDDEALLGVQRMSAGPRASAARASRDPEVGGGSCARAELRPAAVARPRELPRGTLALPREAGIAAPRGARALWALLRAIESQAIAQYGAFAPALAAAKGPAAAALLAGAPDDGALARSELARPAAALLASAGRVRDEGTALLIQGLVLERVRAAIYAGLARADVGAEPARGLAGALAAASARAAALAPARLAALCAQTGLKPLQWLVAATREVLGDVGAVCDGIEAELGAQPGLRAADLTGELVAELVPVCEGLGMARRLLMAHLVGSLIGA